MSDTTDLRLLTLVLQDNNLYADGRVYAVDPPVLARKLLKYQATEKDSYHLVVKGDNLVRIAWTYYKDRRPDAGKYWWVIADANSIQFPLDISDLEGKEILIPDIDNVDLRR